jgi:hypothetical protein
MSATDASREFSKIGATAIASGLQVQVLDGDFDRMPGVIRAPF